MWKKKREDTSRRIIVMDELRGILILYVVIYHLMFDIHELYRLIDIPWMYSTWMNVLRDIMVGMLMLISGVSCSYSRNNLKRGVRIFLVGCVITVMTAIFSPDHLILFGILHFFGIGIILYSVLKKILLKISPIWGTMTSLFLYFYTRNIYYGYLGIFTPIKYRLPDRILQLKILYPLGFPVEGLSSGDYYPLIPWIFLLFAGAFLGRIIKVSKLPPWVYEEHSNVLTYIGRHTLVIYLAHQPILYCLLYIIYQLSNR